MSNPLRALSKGLDFTFDPNDLHSNLSTDLNDLLEKLHWEREAVSMFLGRRSHGRTRPNFTLVCGEEVFKAVTSREAHERTNFRNVLIDLDKQIDPSLCILYPELDVTPSEVLSVISGWWLVGVDDA